ncbi:MAG: FAD-dependent oxidoreductase [Jaaginema sp. PMC 1079.18]|nr:FAD-dependent oxidoreductase [Jaaginema sp. PMC 1080.18]MEC4853225.1 FAD-dependent oxidoreductase [Jaaginema sp. PMC 1079.18]MEC4866452.1 FAD-dependent oxidoreductase [Jaaginema sp. PMC 1078.18]
MALTIAVIGAGLAGLTCAKQLQDRGFDTILLDKSRGLGGRVATRRLHETRVDHGLPFWEVQGSVSQRLTHTLAAKKLLHPWGDRFYQLHSDGTWEKLAPTQRYITPDGINAIAKVMAARLKVQRQFRVVKLTVDESKSVWQIASESSQIQAQAIVLAIPAPQALDLLLASDLDIFPALHRVRFHPGLAVMAGYDLDFPALGWQAVKLKGDRDLHWIVRDSNKYHQPSQPTFVLHSTPDFAQHYLDTPDLKVAQSKLLHQVSQRLKTDFTKPQWVQIHRWRYARTHQALNEPCLLAQTPLPLVCCGDWCLGSSIESALQSGQAAAQAFSTILLQD